jgi:Fic family protein
MDCLCRAIEHALSMLDIILLKSQLNKRQSKILSRLLDDFEGKLTSSKWAKITKCSQDTAYRDILDLITRGILVKNLEGGRSTSYSLVMPPK